MPSNCTDNGKLMKKKIIVIITWLTLQSVLGTVTAQTGMDQTAAQIADKMGIGWNLGNTLEAGNNANNFTNKGGLGAETSWQDTKTTQAIVDYVKSLGFGNIRIPCAWVMGHISNPTTYEIDQAWMKRVKEVVDYCIKAGLYTVINQHWDGGWLENHIKDTGSVTLKKNKDILNAIWTQIATEFRDYDEHLLFAGLNEPNFDENGNTAQQIANLVEYEQTFIDAVRATGGNNEKRVLIIQGPSTNIDHTCKFLTLDKLPKDPTPDKLMLEVHYYSPWQFWGMEKDESWGKVFYYWGEGNHQPGSQHNATWGEESYMREELLMMKTHFADKGYPVYIGEFGANWRTITGNNESQAKHDASIKQHYRMLCQTALEMGIVPVMWDTNYRSRPSMTIVNRKDRNIFNQLMMDGILDAVTAGVSTPSTLLQNVSSHAYTLQGTAVDPTQLTHGLYIMNGHKYLK